MTELATAPPTPPPPSSPTIDFARPFRFVFEDRDWITKVLIGGLFYIAAIFLVGLPFIFGYMVRLTRNVIRGDATPLPEWDNLGEYFIDGLKIILIGFVYLLPSMLLLGLIFGGMAMMGAFPDEELEGPAGCLFGCGMAIFVVLILAYSFFLPAALLMFAATGSVGEALNIGRIGRFVRANLGNYVLAYLINLAASFLSQFGVILLCIGAFFAAFWALAVTSYAFGDVYRLAKVR